MRTDLSPATGSAVGAVAVVGTAIALVPLRATLGNTNVALIFVIVIVAAAFIGGRAAGAVTSVVACLAFNFFHTEPYLTLRIDESHDIVTAVLLVVVGLIIGELAVLHDRSRRAEEAGRVATGAFYRVAELLADDVPVEAVEDEVLAGISETLHLRAARFVAGSDDPGLPEILHSGRLDVREWAWTGEGFALPADGVEIAVRVGAARYGTLVLDPEPGTGVSVTRRRAAVALADQLAAALARSSPAGPPDP